MLEPDTGGIPLERTFLKISEISQKTPLLESLFSTVV